MAANKTKRELEDEIKKLETEKAELHTELRKMRLNADRGFEDSHSRAKLLDNINYLKNRLELEQNKSADLEKRYKQAQRQQQTLNLSADTPETSHEDSLNRLADQVARLEDQVENARITITIQKETIRNLRNIIDDLVCCNKVAYPHQQTPKRNVPGRPRSIDDQTRRRVRKLRKQGYTMRQIAVAEDISLTSVNNIVKGKQ